MAMDAKQAASLVKSNNFEDVDALYTALNGNDEYEKEFAALLKYIDAKVKMDMLRYTGMADAAEAVDKLDEKTNPLDEKDAAYAEMRAKLDKIELYETVEENGKQVTRVATGAARDQAIARLVDAAKLEAKSELRGGSNTEFPSAKKFANAKDDKEREAIYQKTLNEKMDLAILQSFLAGESAKISQEMQEKYKGDEVKAQNEFKKKITKRSKEIKKKIAELGQSASAKLELAVDGIVGYCADAAQRAVVSGVVFAGEQLFAVGSAKFEKEHLFPVFAGVDVGGIGLCRHDPANDPFSAVLGNAVGFVLFVVEIVFVLNRCVFEVFKVHMSLLGICFIFFVF